MTKPSAEYLHKRFRYDDLTGVLFWREWNTPGWQHRFENEPVGRTTSKGYLQATLDGKCYVVHHIIWCMITGSWPNIKVDHKNRNRTDNRFNNFRLANNGQNRANSKSSAKSGFKGVYKNRNCWQAAIVFNKKRIYLGNFKDKESAHVAYSKAAKEFHREFARP
jgi:hypothetical protein